MATLRSKITQIAIESLRGGVKEKKLAKLCLEACDTNRSKSISIGLEMLDSKSNDLYNRSEINWR